MTGQTHTDDLRLAHVLADNADSVAMRRFRAADLEVRGKGDGSPVTDADVAVEEAIRATLKKARPRDAVHAEELEDTGWGPRRWVIDPIDGTKGFLRGSPVWANLISLMVDNEVVLGVVSAPALNRRWWASVDQGAYAGKSLLQGHRIHVSTVRLLEDAALSYSSLGSWIASEYGQTFVDLLRICDHTRAFGDFWSYMLLAEGCVDIAAEPQLALHDMAAVSIIVSEAGGRFTNLEGTPGVCGPGALASNGVVHDELLQLLAGEFRTNPLGV